MDPHVRTDDEPRARAARAATPAGRTPPVSAGRLRFAICVVAIFAVVLTGGAIISLPTSTRAYFGAPTCGFIAMQPADLCRYEHSSGGPGGSRGRNEYRETLLPSGIVPHEVAATTGRVTVSNYDEMRDIRRGAIRLNLIAEVVALVIGLLMARSLIRRAIARLRARTAGAPSSLG